MNQNDKLLAVLSHILGLFTGFLGALVIYLVADQENYYVRKNAEEALNFQIGLCIGYVISCILVFVLIGIIGLIVLYFANIIFCILGAVQASKGEVYIYPASIRLIK